MNFFRNFLFIIFSLFITSYVPLKSMQQKPLGSAHFKTKIFIFPYAIVNSKVQLFGGSKNLHSWKPFETELSTNIKSLKNFVLDLEFEVARSLHYQTLGLFAHHDIKLQNALDLEHGINYFLNKFDDEKIYYLNDFLDTVIFFIEVPYIKNSTFNYQQQKFLERIEKAKKQKKDYPEFFKKDNFDWISIDEIYQKYNDLDLTKATKNPIFKELVSAIKSRSQLNFIIGIDSNELF